MNLFEEIQNQDQRFLILVSLIHMGFDGNELMLKTALDAYGHRVSSDAMLAHLGFLEAVGLVELSKIGSITKAKLTGKGQDVAEGREAVDGVRRPKAGEL